MSASLDRQKVSAVLGALPLWVLAACAGRTVSHQGQGGKGGEVVVASGGAVVAMAAGVAGETPRDEARASPRACPPRDHGDYVDTTLGLATATFHVACVRCHDPVDGSNPAEPHFSSLGDLVARGFLDPCEPESSVIVQSMQEGRMPPMGDIIGLNDRELATVEQGISRMCGVTELNRYFCDEAPGYPGCDRIRFETFLSRECGGCHATTASSEHHVPWGSAEVDDLDALIRDGFILPCDADSSPILQVLRAGVVAPHESCVSFPPERSLTRMTAFVPSFCSAR